MAQRIRKYRPAEQVAFKIYKSITSIASEPRNYEVNLNFNITN